MIPAAILFFELDGIFVSPFIWIRSLLFFLVVVSLHGMVKLDMSH